jgi:hypothetical protein
MKKEYMDKQLEIYEQGLSSVDEERELVSLLGDSEKGSNSWFKYIDQHKKIAPQNLESNIWSTIQSKEQRKRRKLFRISSVAASVILAVSLFFTLDIRYQDEMSYSEKMAALEEALALISEAPKKPVLEEILYEDEIIIIYLK